MNNKFEKEFYATRDEILEEIKETKSDWNVFLKYWSRVLDNHEIDNILNLYSYNKSGICFKTFDEWNNDDIGRRIKPKSKGIPIYVNEHKIYVFDISQTYGREYNIWNYNHLSDKELEMFTNKGILVYSLITIIMIVLKNVL